MNLSWDENKRRLTFETRGLDFALAGEIFNGPQFSYEDRRIDYGEIRIVSTGFIHGRLCVVVWTQRGNKRHIISLRKANDKEQDRFENHRMD